MSHNDFCINQNGILQSYPSESQSFTIQAPLIVKTVSALEYVDWLSHFEAINCQYPIHAYVKCYTTDKDK